MEDDAEAELHESSAADRGARSSFLSRILQVFGRGTRKRRRRAAVVVLGDLGRSPRMQYHALSLARQAGLDVDVVAFGGTEPHAGLLQHPHIHLHLMRFPFPQGLPRILYILLVPFKLMLQCLTLLWFLCYQIPAPDFYLVQNPPSIPTLTVVKIACWLRQAAFVIDWHNFGYTILALSLGPRHLFVKIYSWYERRFGKTADGFLCVTKAMQHELEQNWGIRATVLYDRSPEFFRSINLREKHELFCRLHAALTRPPGVRDCCGDGLLEAPTKSSHVGGADSGAGPSVRKVLKEKRGQPVLLPSSSDANEDNVDLQNGFDYTVPKVQRSLFTVHKVAGDTDGEIQGGDHYSYEEGRPALIVSSTSWTQDEDFGILLEAAVMYDRRVAALLGESDSTFLDTTFDTNSYSRTASPFPRLLIVVTGKGPMRETYEERIRKLRLRRVAFRTMWLSAEEYPLLLGAADLGVCLHTSSSGLDLPMKVVDMFGCGLPVCAVSYSCIDELVKDRQNGLLFSSSSELADQLLDLFKGFPNACNFLETLRRGASASGSSSRWDDEWSEHVLPLLTKVASRD
ncbi:hypothetical protein M758_6G159000 [Ceratodon purpureus]|nr:hypothetical protein M758_6G159000 [Ceratodon purpureus]